MPQHHSGQLWRLLSKERGNQQENSVSEIAMLLFEFCSLLYANLSFSNSLVRIHGATPIRRISFHNQAQQTMAALILVRIYGSTPVTRIRFRSQAQQTMAACISSGSRYC
ncbi:uncharacterized protein LOC107802852 [Nicotiana tabacum]|uniref:Uncharacterized protein LOC107802852 n=1 Tax=Nicotiana tabacum TaxID=4097 RepID=A0A1S4AZG8_TOBAC|nr:uncharacterized protein LOC104116633 isoform X2 [Nicotiana tomentosiformis]XP_016481913.1 PREDICTED: uncharacterized protein LOC107802852 [Nicotiana tabacum]